MFHSRKHLQPSELSPSTVETIPIGGRLTQFSVVSTVLADISVSS
jgi:hypothetical protein